MRIGATPTIPRRPAAQRERDRLQARRLRAAELFAAGVRQAEVARQLEVSAQAVSVWHARWREGGIDALHGRGAEWPGAQAVGRTARADRAAPAGGATAHGLGGELWTLDRIAAVIQRLTGMEHHPPGVWAVAPSPRLERAAAQASRCRA